MVDTNKLRGVIAENGKTQADVAEMIGVTPKTFYMRMSKGVFGSDEIQVMIDNLHIQNPMDIFFAKKVTSKVTKLERSSQMVDTNKLRGVIAENGKTQADVAEMIGVTPKTFYMRMSKGVFGSDEIQVMIDNLHIQNPMDIFFAKKVT